MRPQRRPLITADQVAGANRPPVLVRLEQALEAFVRACDEDEELTRNNAPLWDAYETARDLLGDPVTDHPGGYDDTHYHPYGWGRNPPCDTCEDYREEQAQEKAAKNPGLIAGASDEL